MSCTKNNIVPLFNAHGVVEVVLDAARSGGTNEIRAVAIAILWNLCAEVGNLVPLCKTPGARSEEHTSELQSHSDHVCRLLLEKKNLSPPANRPLIGGFSSLAHGPPRSQHHVGIAGPHPPQLLEAHPASPPHRSGPC